jgi:hypothetical protein
MSVLLRRVEQKDGRYSGTRRMSQLKPCELISIPGITLGCGPVLVADVVARVGAKAAMGKWAYSVTTPPHYSLSFRKPPPDFRLFTNTSQRRKNNSRS